MQWCGQCEAKEITVFVLLKIVSFIIIILGEKVTF